MLASNMILPIWNGVDAEEARKMTVSVTCKAKRNNISPAGIGTSYCRNSGA